MPLLSPVQKRRYARDGYLLLRRFYSLRRDILPIQRAVHAIIGLVIRRHGLPIRQRPFGPGRFDSGYQELIAANRAAGGEVYDAVKQIPAYIRLVADPRHERLLAELRGASVPGIAAGGYGIRIDNPREERYRAPWHQEYPAQLRSLDGLVLWSPLVALTPELGPVQICVGSHRLGPLPVRTRDPANPDKAGAYALILENEAALVRRFEHAAPLAAPGDLLILDFLTVHASGHNHGSRSRWSMQMRLFNFREPTGMRIGWKGSFAAGVDFRKIHPELCVD
jgi:hypothetical protein